MGEGGSMSGAKNPYAVRHGKGYRFYLVNPQSGASASKTAAKLMKISGVSEVIITEGRYGFIVRAQAETAPQGRRVYSAIQSCVKGSLSEAVAHFRYVK